MITRKTRNMCRPFKSLSTYVIPVLIVLSPILISGTSKEQKKIITPIADASSPISNASVRYEKHVPSEVVTPANNAASLAQTLYATMKLNRVGLSKKAFEYALKGHQYMVSKKLIRKTDVLSICDFSQSSRRKRLYVINLQSLKLLLNTHVAHGRNSGGEFARSFSNKMESHQSSLGFYVTGGTYWGAHGLSLQIDGLESGINDRANERKIVVHGSPYVGDQFLRANPFTGRSYGCPAVPAKYTAKLIDIIKNGSCLFIYHPTQNYISKSKILNG
jgi:hypothetical protein